MTQLAQPQASGEAASRTRRARRLGVSARKYVVMPSLLLLWEVLVRALDVPGYLLPPVSDILARLWGDREILLTEAIPTLLEIWGGYLIAVGVGFALAVPIAYSRVVEDAMFPLLVTLQVIPKVALAPLLLVWLGFGMTPKVLIAALIAFFPIVVNTVKGLRSVEPEMVQWCKTLGASGRQLFVKLSLPWALPYIFAGMKVSIGLATVGAVVGEFIGTDRGLGYLMLRAMVNMDTTMIFAALVTVSAIGVASYGIVTLLERRLLSWQASAEAAPETL